MSARRRKVTKKTPTKSRRKRRAKRGAQRARSAKRSSHSGGSTASSTRSIHALSWTRTATASATSRASAAASTTSAWLGVDALWLSPTFPSPMADFGYDVADYCGIDPLFGTLADFDRLIADAHARGIRIMLDLVPNHSSSEHPWFRESRASRRSPKRDWYVWRDPRRTAPRRTTGSACSAGPAWTLDATTGQYYLHSFLPEQPDLNWRNPALVRAMHDVVRFWFERGVDGFRIDVIHRIAKDPKLRDNPVRDPSAWLRRPAPPQRREPQRRAPPAARPAQAREPLPGARLRGRGVPDEPRRSGALLRPQRRATPRLQLLVPARALGRARRSGAKPSASRSTSGAAAGPITCCRATTRPATPAATTTPSSATRARGSRR